MSEGDEASAARVESPPTRSVVPPGSETIMSDVRHSMATGSTRPSSIGAYKVIDVLGEGGMGVVYLAEQREPLRRQVALKLIKLGMDTKEVLGRFESERQTLALMNHPNIARVFDAGSTPDGRPYFVMEHVPGVPFTDYCDRNKLGLRERLQLFIDVCAAAQHAHAAGIIHRDLKPSNVLVMELDGKPVPKIIDFGVSKATRQRLGDRTVHTQIGEIIGTPEYMSPEQVEMSALNIDHRADVYSIGAMLYQVLVGDLPHDSKTLRSAGLGEIQRIIREDDPPKPSARLTASSATSSMAAQRRGTDLGLLVREIRGDLDWITMKALEKDRNRRYQSAAEVSEDIQRYLRNEPVKAGPPSFLRKLRRAARRHRAAVLAASAIVLTAAVLGGVAWSSAWRELRRDLGDAWKAVEARDEKLAREKLMVLKHTRGGHADVAKLEASVAMLEVEKQVESARTLLEASRKGWDAFLSHGTRIEELTKTWRDAQKSFKSWQPPWERDEEISAWSKLEEGREELERSYNDALLFAYRALEDSPAGSAVQNDARLALEGIYWKRYTEARRDGSVALSAGFFRQMIESLGVGTHKEELSERGKAAFATDPPGADVYCFRFEEREVHRVPIPFNPILGAEDPTKGLLAKPFLVIDEVVDEELAGPLHAGDRLIEAAGREVGLIGDLAAALQNAGSDDEVEVKVMRGGAVEPLRWVPFPKTLYTGLPAGTALRPGRVLDPPRQLGIVFAGYPLDFTPECKVGATGQVGLEVLLPKGSYVFVLRKHGFADARYPVAVPEDAGVHLVRMVKEERIPPGFVYVPAGESFHGGDPEAYEPLEGGRARVEGFFMSRNEVTLGEYEEFLNDDSIRPRLDRDGTAEPLADWDSKELQRLRPDSKRLRLVPISDPKNASPLYVRDDASDKWSLVQRASRERLPVIGVPMLAGVEYALWLTRKNDGRWRFRLPQDLEWERAARGADRRLYVWGNYPVYGYTCSLNGDYRKGAEPVTPRRIGRFPLDESVFGVRDLGGSISEPVLAVAATDLRLCVFRGANWEATDRRDFHVASRDRGLPEGAYRYRGLRIVADLDPPGKE